MNQALDELKQEAVDIKAAFEVGNLSYAKREISMFPNIIGLSLLHPRRPAGGGNPDTPRKTTAIPHVRVAAEQFF